MEARRDKVWYTPLGMSVGWRRASFIFMVIAKIAAKADLDEIWRYGMTPSCDSTTAFWRHLTAIPTRADQVHNARHKDVQERTGGDASPPTLTHPPATLC